MLVKSKQGDSSRYKSATEAHRAMRREGDQAELTRGKKTGEGLEEMRVERRRDRVGGGKQKEQQSHDSPGLTDEKLAAGQ